MNVKKYYKQVMIALGCGLLFCGLLAVDLGSKALAEWYHEAHGLAQSEYFLGFIRLTYAQNYDVAYGIIGQIFEDPAQQEIAMQFVLRKSLPVRICLAVVEAGALGNMIDRFVLGYVRDFIDVRPIGFNICNIADIFITGGIVAVLVCVLFIGKDAVFPASQKWREEAKREDAAREARERAKKDAAEHHD